MISVDTNILLRYLLQDDENQARKAGELMAGRNKILVTDIVLVEMLWTLKGRRYRLDRDALLQVVEQLFKEPSIVFEDGQAIWRTLQTLKQKQQTKSDKKNRAMDFSDVLIVEKTKFVCSLKDEDYRGTYSFDHAMQQLDGVLRP